MNPVAYKELQDKLEKGFTDVETIKELYGTDTAKAALEKDDHANLIDRAKLHDPQARNLILSRYVQMLRYFGYNDRNKVKQIFDFDDIQHNPDDFIFESLLLAHDITYYLNKYKIGQEVLDESGEIAWSPEDLEQPVLDDFPEKFSAEKLRRIAEEESRDLQLFYKNSSNRLRLLAIIMFSRVYGFSVIDSLGYHRHSENGVRDKDYVYIIYRGVKIWLSFLHFHSAAEVSAIQSAATSLTNGTKFEVKNPHVISSMHNSSRVTVAGFVMTPPNKTYYNERLFTAGDEGKITLEDLRDKYHTIDDRMYKINVLHQQGRGRTMVIGPFMGVGKTSYLGALLSKTPPKWGIGVLDPQNELQLDLKYPWLNVYTLTTSENRSIADCFEAMLKQARDILCVSEVAGYEEMAELVKGAKRLNAGISATMHSGSVEELVSNCADLLMETGKYDTRAAAELAVAKSLDFVPNLINLPGGRIVVESLSEVIPVDPDVLVTDLELGDGYTFEQKRNKVLDLAQMYLSNKLYTKGYRVQTLIRYNRAKDDWDVVGKPSENYMQRLASQLPPKAVEYFASLFTEGDVA